MTAEDSKRTAKELPELPIDFLGSGGDGGNGHRSVKKSSKKKSSTNKKSGHHEEEEEKKKKKHRHHKHPKHPHHHDESSKKDMKDEKHKEKEKDKKKKSSKSHKDKHHHDKKEVKKEATTRKNDSTTHRLQHPQRQSSNKAPSSAIVNAQASALNFMKQLSAQNKKGLVGLKMCGGCHQPEDFCCCTRGGNDYADDGFSCCAAHHVYYSKYGYTPFDITPVSFVFSAAEDGLVRLSPAPGFLIADVNTQFGFDADTEVGSTVAVAGLLAPDVPFNRVYFIEDLPNATDNFYLLQPLNILDADCLIPIAGDKWQIMNGPSSLMYTIVSIADCDLNWELAEDLLQSVIKVHRAYIACCDDNDC
jgi:hypothetical protein